MEKRLKPECSYFTDGTITMRGIEKALVRKTALTAKVSSIDPYLKKVYLKLGNGFIAEMDWNDSTICELTFKNNFTGTIPNQIAAIENKKIRVLVKNISSTGIITVSRRDNMKRAWNIMCQIPDGTVLDAAVVGVHKYGSAVYYDIGEGITGFCHLYNFTSTRVLLRNWIQNGEIHQVQKFGQPDLLNYSFNCSRKNACFKGYEDYKKYDIIDVKVAAPIYELDKETGTNVRSAYYVEINPVVTGIAQVPFIPREIEYGDIVQAAIKRINVTAKKMWLALL